jgi:hypothetical protein
MVQGTGTFGKDQILSCLGGEVRQCPPKHGGQPEQVKESKALNVFRQRGNASGKDQISIAQGEKYSSHPPKWRPWRTLSKSEKANMPNAF